MTLQQVGGGRDLEYRGKVTIIFNFVEHFCRKGRETITKNDRQNCFEPLESVQDQSHRGNRRKIMQLDK